MQTYLVTGAAGFIASKVAEQLLDRGDAVVGVDNLNDAYDVRLKEWRLRQLQDRDHFTMIRGDIADANAVAKLFDRDYAAVITNSCRTRRCASSRSRIRRSTLIRM